MWLSWGVSVPSQDVRGFVEHATSMQGDGPNPGLLTQQSPCLPGTHLSCTLNSKITSRDRGAAGWR